MKMRTRLPLLLGIALAFGVAAPVASAKIFFPMREHVLVVGKQVRLGVPGCNTGAGCITLYPGPVRVYLVRASAAPDVKPIESAEPPASARALGRLGDLGRLKFTPRAAGRFRLVALISVQPSGGDVSTMRMTVSPVFVVHPRGWQKSG